jgi:hypothetical protein
MIIKQLVAMVVFIMYKAHDFYDQHWPHVADHMETKNLKKENFSCQSLVSRDPTDLKSRRMTRVFTGSFPGWLAFEPAGHDCYCSLYLIKRLLVRFFLAVFYDRSTRQTDTHCVHFSLHKACQSEEVSDTQPSQH